MESSNLDTAYAMKSATISGIRGSSNWNPIGAPELEIPPLIVTHAPTWCIFIFQVALSRGHIRNLLTIRTHEDLSKSLFDFLFYCFVA